MKYKAKVQFIFEGEVEIEADNKEEAKASINDNFGCTLGNLHTTIDESGFIWDFDVHPVETNIEIL